MEEIFLYNIAKPKTGYDNETSMLVFTTRNHDYILPVIVDDEDAEELLDNFVSKSVAKKDIESDVNWIDREEGIAENFNYYLKCLSIKEFKNGLFLSSLIYEKDGNLVETLGFVLAPMVMIAFYKECPILIDKKVLSETAIKLPSISKKSPYYEIFNNQLSLSDYIQNLCKKNDKKFLYLI
jgi:bifunctional DNase/RNase